MKAMAAGLTEWLEARTPQYAKQKKAFFAAELSAITEAYTKMFVLRLECEVWLVMGRIDSEHLQQKSEGFQKKFSQIYEKTLSAVKDDVLTSVTASGKDWEKYLDGMSVS